MKHTIKKSLSFLIAILMLCCILPVRATMLEHEPMQPSSKPEIWDGSIAGGYAGGSGTEDDPYLISNGAELAYLAQQVNSGNLYEDTYFDLTADVYLNDIEGWENWGTTSPANNWTAIGCFLYADNIMTDNPFRGNFNGDGHIVFGIYINKTGDDWYTKSSQGLFGYNKGTITSLGTKNSYIHGDSYIGGVVGWNQQGTILHCFNTGTIDGVTQVGGISGRNYGNVLYCFNSGNISSTNTVAGIAGINDGTVSNSYNIGNVSSAGNGIGGVVGMNNGGGPVTDCYNTGIISGNKQVGGIAGSNNLNAVSNCYNIGTVSGNEKTGGVVGSVSGNNPIVSNCYYLNTCCEESSEYGTALTEEQMLMQSSYECFDFIDVWTMEGNPDYIYPELNGNNHVSCGSNEPIEGIWDGGIAEGFAGGDGTEEDPYLISDGSHLAYLAQQVNNGNLYEDVYFKLTDDICLNNTNGWEKWFVDPPANEWIAIGKLADWNPDTYEYEIDYPFLGHFDGNNNSILGVYINKLSEDETADWQGVFGHSKGTIINLSVEASYICGHDSVGGIAGDNDGLITNCMNAATVSCTGSWVGGITGFSYGNGSITDCCNIGDITGDISYGYGNRVGGISGEDWGTTNNCYNEGNISGWWEIGGISGYFASTHFITDCYNTGSISGEKRVGGIAGINAATIINCYNTGNVIGTGEAIGGVAGWNFPGKLICCYNTGNVNGGWKVGGVTGFNQGYSSGSSFAGGIINNCYNIGDVTGSETIGGVIGNNKGTAKCCYNIGNVTGNVYVGGAIGLIDGLNTAENCYYLNTCCINDDQYSTALTDEQMQNAENFAGFNFETVWTMEGEPDYPYPELNYRLKVTFIDRYTQEEIPSDYFVRPGMYLEEENFPAPPIHENYDFLGWSYTREPIFDDVVVTAVYLDPNNFEYYFEVDPSVEGWTWEDHDDDDKNWQWMYDKNYNAPEGLGIMISQSFDWFNGPLTPDNWLISPLVPGGGQVSFMLVAQNPDFPGDPIGVYASTDGGETWSEELGYFVTTADIQTCIVDLNTYAGQNIKLAFRHYDAYNRYTVNFDAVIVTPNEVSPTEPPTEEPPTEEPPTEEPPTEEPPTEEPPTEEPPTEEPPTEEPPTEEPPTETPTEPPAPPTTGFISLAGAGIAAILAGAGVVLFRRKRS